MRRSGLVNQVKTGLAVKFNAEGRDITVAFPMATESSFVGWGGAQENTRSKR